MEMTPTYRLLQGIARFMILRVTRVQVEGLENVPSSGSCIFVSNHQSALDPILLQGMCPRMISTMTKSTQFASPIMRFLLRSGEAFPVRRYKVDPQAVRTLLRKLDEGYATCLYPEGERSWDGTLRPLRRGAVRTLLRVGVPIIPVGIAGMYDVWPRWRGVPRLGLPVVLRFGEPIDLGVHRGRSAREAALPEAEERIRSALLRLSGEKGRGDGAEAPEVDLQRNPFGSTVRGNGPG
jgi:1-acyl-sn-glycerol-3-phosphate acyltransferase